MSQQFHAVLYCKTQYSNSLMSSLSRILSGWGMLSVCLETLVVLDFFFHCAFEFLACVSAWHFTQDSHLVRSKRQNMFILLYFLLLINFQLLSTVMSNLGSTLFLSLQRRTFEKWFPKYFKRYEIFFFSGIPDNLPGKTWLEWKPNEGPSGHDAVDHPQRGGSTAPRNCSSSLKGRRKNFVHICN